MVFKITGLLYASVILNGFCNLSIFGVMCELVVEVSFPKVGEATSVGFLNVIINIMQFLAILLVTPILDRRDEASVRETMSILIAITLLGVLLTICTPVNYMRTEYLNQEKSN